MNDDDDLERLFAAMERRYDEHVVSETDSMEERLTATPDSSQVPMPGDCHPALERHRAWLQAWLDGDPQYTHYGDHMRIPVPRRLEWVPYDKVGPMEAWEPLPTLTLTRRRCAGLTPYVGQPFVYTWDVAVDDHGRWVAGAARLTYIPFTRDRRP